MKVFANVCTLVVGCYLLYGAAKYYGWLPVLCAWLLSFCVNTFVKLVEAGSAPAKVNRS